MQHRSSLNCDPTVDDLAVTAMAVAKIAALPIEASNASDATMSSSSSVCSSSDALDDDYGAPDLSSSDDDEQPDVEAAQDAVSHFLVKPMSTRLQVCPVDDLAVEDEKRRRRSRRNQKSNNAAVKGASRDAESLPDMPSPIMTRTRRSGSTPALPALDRSVNRHRPLSPKQTQPPASTGSILAPAAPLLRKDSAAIRRQYWSQLGFSLSRRDLEKSTGRKTQRREGLKVRLNDADVEEQSSKGFLRFIKSWYAPITAVSGEEKTLNEKPPTSARQLRSSLSRASGRSSSSESKKGVSFNEEAELFYIPLHRDYSKRQRDCMWPTRAEFVAMVERNLDAVYDEMEREYETQLENEYLENEGMAREEARQRTIEAAQRRAAKTSAEAEAASQRSSVSPPLSRCSSTMSASIPTLNLSQQQVLVSPRARSSHDLRFKYLKHLGIDS